MDDETTIINAACGLIAIERLSVIEGTFFLFGITAGCTVFMIPDGMIPSSDFTAQLRRIDARKTKECYGAVPHTITYNGDFVELAIYLMQQKILFVVDCEWHFNGFIILLFIVAYLFALLSFNTLFWLSCSERASRKDPFV
ncbi:unnamed protein product [Anisakis simplex]|uniref:PDR_CDR domain-containing protein n=1 Tax=Anisakis simplex TaxID=6269 RepID=A0A0M3KCC2_ANISI|nr:unnamed protein product [Anisakis simplex]